jgi:hypothetical protein
MSTKTADAPESHPLNAAQAALLAAAAGRTGTLSPLETGGAQPADEAQRQELIRAGLLAADGSAGEATAILANPSAQIIATVGGKDGARALCAYAAAGRPSSLAGYTPQGGGEYLLNYPLSREHLGGLLSLGLGLEAETRDLGIDVELSMDALCALAGFVDASREIELDNMLARRPSHLDQSITADRIYLAAQEGQVNDDFRWLATATHRLSPFDIDISDDSIERGLQELKKLGWLSDTGGDWSATERFLLPRMHLVSLLGCGRLSIQLVGASQPASSYLGIIRSLACVWTLRFAQAGPNQARVRLATVRGPALAKVIDDLLASALQALMEQAPAASAGGRVCPACQAPVGSDDVFCSNCGAKLR